MSQELRTVLRLVAEGKLSPDEAAPIIEALSQPAGGRTVAEPSPAPDQRRTEAGEESSPSRGRRVRIQVMERGRRVVDLRVPLAFAAAAARSVPGIPAEYAALIERAVEGRTTGTIVDAEDESGDGVLIALE